MSTYKVIKTFKNGETNTVDNLSVPELQGLIKADTGKWFDDVKEGIAFYEQFDFKDFTVTVNESLYKQLKAIITKNNAIYDELTDKVFDLKNNVNESAEDVKLAEHKQWQFIHYYATELSTFIWDHMTELKPEDLSATLRKIFYKKVYFYMIYGIIVLKLIERRLYYVYRWS